MRKRDKEFLCAILTLSLACNFHIQAHQYLWLLALVVIMIVIMFLWITGE